MSQAKVLWLFIISIFFFNNIAFSKHLTGFSLKLISMDSPESPFYLGNISYSEKLNRLVEISQARALILSKGYNTTAILPMSYVTQSYVVKVQIGSPKIPAYLAVDTGSSLTWTQCEPCINCYPQTPPKYNSLASRTYQPISCNHPLCQNNSLFRCVDNKCIYSFGFLDGSSTAGIAATELFNFLPEHIPMMFGCSNDNRGFKFPSNTLASGILGLNTGKESILSQFHDITLQRFSYCLLSPYSPTTAITYLRFGSDVNPPGRGYASTPFTSPPRFGHYYLKLNDISVHGWPMGFPPGTFDLKPNGTGGCVLDSGSAVTVLSQYAYDIVMNSFVNYFKRYELERFHGHPRFELCYRMREDFREYPTMTYHFEGGNLRLENRYVIGKDDQLGIFCVVMLAHPHLTVIGSMHQQNVRFIFDLNFGVIHYGYENCERAS